MSNLSLMTRVSTETIESLRNGIIPWADHDQLTVRHAGCAAGFAFNGETHRRYNLLNQLILGKAGAWYTISAIARMNSELHLEGDARIRIGNGESPKWVKQWFPIRREREQDAENNATEVEDDDTFFAFKAIRVWHETQLVNLPAHNVNPITDGCGETVTEALCHYIETSGVTYDGLANEVTPSTYFPARDAFCTAHYSIDHDFDSDMAHELAHSTGHPSRLHRFEEDAPIAARGEQFNLEELVAEIAAGMIMAQFGRNLYIANRTRYIQQWIETLENNPTMFCKAATRAEKAVAFMLPELFPSIMPDRANPFVEAPAEPEVVMATCSYCGNSVPEDTINNIHGHAVCNSCVDTVAVCERCDILFDRAAIRTHFGQEFALCPNCHDRRFPRWGHNYGHLHHGASFHGNTNHYMGFECETSPDLERDALNTDNAYGELMYKSTSYDCNALWHCTTDATINNRLGHGIEIVSHPADIDWWMSNSAIDDMCAIAHDNGLYSHDSVGSDGVPKCGLHVHINRDWLTDGLRFDCTEDFAKKYGAAKLFAALYSLSHEPSRKHGWSTLEKFARRQCSGYCQQMDAPDHLSQWGTMTRSDVVADLHEWIDYNSRYHVVNMENANTIEIRIFRGTVKANTIKATLQFVNNLVEYTRTHTMTECMCVGIADVINYKHYDELTAYAQARRV